MNRCGRFAPQPLLFLAIAFTSAPPGQWAMAGEVRPLARIANTYDGLNRLPAGSQVESREQHHSAQGGPTSRRRCSRGNVFRGAYAPRPSRLHVLIRAVFDLSPLSQRRPGATRHAIWT
jgi:hypothetical protein